MNNLVFSSPHKKQRSLRPSSIVVVVVVLDKKYSDTTHQVKRALRYNYLKIVESGVEFDIKSIADAEKEASEAFNARLRIQEDVEDAEEKES